MKLKNANIKTKEEAAKRLENGEVFYSQGNKIYYDKNYIFSASSPFRVSNTIDNVPLYGMWDLIQDWKVEEDLLMVATKENPVLAFRWHEEEKPKYPDAGYVYYDRELNLFVDVDGWRWNNVELVK